MKVFSTFRIFELERTKKLNLPLSLVQSFTFDDLTKVENKQQDEKDIYSWSMFPISESCTTTTRSNLCQAQEEG